MIIVEVISLPGFKPGERTSFHSEDRVRELTTCRPPAVRVVEVKPDAIVLPLQPISEHLQNKFNLNPDGTPRQAKQAEAQAPSAPPAAVAPPKDALELLTVPAKPQAPARKVK